MFELVVIPLIELWIEDAEDEAVVLATLLELQQVLTREVGREISWSEHFVENATFEADGIDPYCVYGLRSAAAWLEFYEDLDTFEVGVEPGEHEIFDRLEERGKAERFPQLLHSEATDCAAFVPAELPDVFMMLEEGSEVEFGVGSVEALRKELDVLRVALGLEEGLEEHIDHVVFDPNEDKLAGPRYGWIVLSARVNEALAKRLPLVLLYRTLTAELEDDFG